MATMDDVHFLQSFRGKRIKITTRGSSFIGVVQRINLNRTLVLEDVVEVQSGIRLAGSKLFFGYEILNVEPPCSPTGQPQRDASKEGTLPVTEFQPYRMEVEDKLQVNYIVVDDFQERFGPALLHIRKQRVIGLASDGVGDAQHQRLCWLQVATKSTVYLFDILLLGARAFKNGLGAILHCEDILKVVHDCRPIARCLWVQFAVDLANVFDTQVADVLHFHDQTGGFLPDRVSTLQEVVSLHLKMPLKQLTSLQVKDELSAQGTEVWYTRPCPTPLLKVMALSVVHLQPLRLVLLDALMSDYTNLVDLYLQNARDEPICTGDLGTTRLATPKELREIPMIKEQRRTWAIDHYGLTKGGLLKRHSDEPESEGLPPESECQITNMETLDLPGVMGNTSEGNFPVTVSSSGTVLLETNASMVGVAHGTHPIPVIGRGLFRPSLFK